MSQQDAFAEAVFFFEGDDISVEMHYSEFEALLNQSATLENFAASQVRGAYVVVGTGLAVRGLVTFMLRVDENGHAARVLPVHSRNVVEGGLAAPLALLREVARRIAKRQRSNHGNGNEPAARPSGARAV